jgi:hypothetical protein
MASRIVGELRKRLLERLHGPTGFNPCTADEFDPGLSHDSDVHGRVIGERSPAMTGIPNLAGWKFVHASNLLPFAIVFYRLHGLVVMQVEPAVPWRRGFQEEHLAEGHRFRLET